MCLQIFIDFYKWFFDALHTYIHIDMFIECVAPQNGKSTRNVYYFEKKEKNKKKKKTKQKKGKSNKNV